MGTTRKQTEGVGARGRWVMAAMVTMAAGTATAGTATAAQLQAGALYLQGLEALSAGKWAEATEAFTGAVDADEDNADYLAARGVAKALSGQAPAAIKDLQRSLRMRDDWETKLWLCAAYYMNGDANNGSLNVTHGPRGRQASKADLDYSQFVYNIGMGTWLARQGRPINVSLEGRRDNISPEELRGRHYVRAAAMFVSRRQADAPAPLAADLLKRAIANMDARRHAEAVKDLDSLLVASPEDDKLLGLRAECLKSLGDYQGSRWDFTRVLTNQPALGAMYLQRSMAAAQLADAARARSDLAVAEKLGAPNADLVRRGVGLILAGIKAPEPAAALAELEKAVREGAEATKLAELATAVQQAVNARRLRYDEIYQDRIRVLTEALREQPRNADRLADLAGYLFAESDTPFEQLEPRSWPVFYRYVPQGVPRYNQQGQLQPYIPVGRTAREVARAAGLIEEALKADPRHVRSMGIRGKILNSRGEHRRALAVLEQAVAIKGDDPVLLRERSVSLQAIARADMLEATALRGPKISTSHNPDGSTTTTTVYPSAADLARAAMLEREAREFGERAKADMAAAMKLAAGTALAAYWQGLTDYAYHNLPQAKADYEQAVKLDPHFREAWEQLARVAGEMGQPEEWAAAREGALRDIQTTAGPWLKVAGDRIFRTQFKGARAALAAARRLDPSDARGQVYEAVIDEANDKAEPARVRLHVALLLEEARNRLSGRDVAAAGAGGAPLPVRPQEIGLTLALRTIVGGHLLEAGKAAQAGPMFEANLKFLSGLAPEAMSTPVPQATLPSTTGEASVVPLTETYATLKVRAQAGSAFVAWVGRHPDPKDAALAGETYKRLVDRAPLESEKLDVLQAVVSLALAELEVARGDNARAMELLRNSGATPQRLWQEMRKTEEAARGAVRTRAEGEFRREQDRRERMTPVQAVRERLLNDRAFFQKGRQSALDELNKPDLSERDRQIYQGQVAEYDKRIRDIDEKLRRIGDGK